MFEYSTSHCITLVGFIVALAFIVDETIICNVFDDERRTLFSCLYAALFVVSSIHLIL